MGNKHILDLFPLWAVYLLTVGLGMLAAEAGFRIGKNWKATHPDESEGAIGAMVGATLGLWAFLLAFVVGIASNRFDLRRALVLDEANSIGTTYLRAGLLSEPYSSQSRELLREYARERLRLVELNTHDTARSRSEAIHVDLWSIAEELAKSNPNPIIASYITSLNETIDLHESRITALTTARIPFTIYAGLYLVAMLGLFMLGFQSGFNGKRNLVVTLVLIMIFSIVLLIIIDLDRSWAGFLRVNQQPMMDLINGFDNFK